MKRKIVTIITCFVFIFAFAFLVACTNRVDPPKEDIFVSFREAWMKDVSVTYGNVSINFSKPNNVKHTLLKSGKTCSIDISNDSEELQTVVLYVGNDVELDENIKDGFAFINIDKNSKKTITFTPKDDISFPCCGLNVGTQVALFVSDSDALYIANNTSEAEYIVLANDINYSGDLVIEKSKTIFNNENKLIINGDLAILSKDDISVQFINSSSDQIYCHDFYADAENCELYVYKEFFDFKYGREFSLSVKKYNGINFHSNIKHIDSKAMLEVLLDYSKYPILKKDMTINIAPDLNLSGVLNTINVPCTIVLEGQIATINKLNIAFEEVGDIYIICVGNYKATSNLFSIDAPNANLFTSCCNISIDEVLKNYNVFSFNGMLLSDSELGGNGEATLKSLSLLKSENRNMTEDIVWTISSNVVTANVNSVIDYNTLSKAKLHLESNGTVKFNDSCLNDDGTVDLLSQNGCFLTVTDTNGEVQRYLVKTVYIPTKLPVVVIDVDNDEEIVSEEEYIGATIRINCDYLNGEFPSLITTKVNIRGRGNSTWKWDKKPYKLHFDTKTSVLGMTANKNWTLLANYADKSLIRNPVALYMGSILEGMPFTTHQYPVDVFVNGEYVGVYTLGEQIEAKKGRVDIDIDDNVNILDTGYLLQVGGTGSGDTWDVTCFKTSMLRFVKVEDPSDDDLTVARVKFIKDYCLAADAAIVAGEGYEDYIDIDSLIDWAIMIELSFNWDSCFHRSVYFLKQAGGKLQMGPIWDFDLGLGNMSRDKDNYEIWILPGSDEEDAYIKINWFNYLYYNEDFSRKFEARWNEIKDKLLEDTLAYIDELYEKVKPSAKYNFEVWDILGKKVAYEPSYTNKYNTYEKQINYLKNYLKSRWEWIDNNISSLPMNLVTTTSEG